MFTDFTIGDTLTTIQPHLRTASVEGRWNKLAILVGQERPIVSPREPSSFAQVQVAPLVGAGNFWLWRPQVRVEQTIGLGPRGEFRARIGVTHTPETGGLTPPEIRATLDPRRPALEGHFQFAYKMDGVRRFEIGSAFHRSKTHVAATSVPADLVSVDWFVRPLRAIEFTGMVYTGRNLSKLGSSGSAQGVATVTTASGQIRVVPVGRRGGWSQLTFLPTSRLTVNLQAGIDDPNDDNLLAIGITQNTALVANTFYRLAPNVVWGVETAQVRSRYKAGQRPQFNHYDFYVAFLF